MKGGKKVAIVGGGITGLVLANLLSPKHQVTIFEKENQLGGLSAGADRNDWQWAPPQNLSPGEHTLTINYYDEENVLQTITRRFQVAAQGSVSPTPTPITPLPTKIPTSAPTLIATPLPSPTITPKPIVTTTVSPAATISGQPTTGNLTPLIIFASLGIVISSFAYLINQKKNGTS